MQETLITLETAKLAKEKGFDNPCSNGFYETLEHELDCGRGGIISFPYIAPRTLSQPAYGVRNENVFIAQAPSQSLLQKWLREVHNLVVLVTIPFDIFYAYTIDGINGNSYYTESKQYKGQDFITYEETLEAGLQEALKLIK
jgi:hypothetical protein